MNKLLIVCTQIGVLLFSGKVHAQTCTNANIMESTPTSRYTFYEDGMVKDTKTSLMWKRCLEGQTFFDTGTPDNYLDDQCLGSVTPMNWQTALNLADTAIDNGYNDWRLPNQKELKSTVEYCHVKPAINMEVFPGDIFSMVWSGSPVVNYGDDNADAWLVDFGYGYGSWGYRRHANAVVRLVRSSQ